MQADFATRQQALRDLLDREGVDAVAIVPGANMVYFTGLHVHLSERPIIALFTRENLSIIIPQLEVPQVVARPDLKHASSRGPMSLVIRARSAKRSMRWGCAAASSASTA